MRISCRMNSHDSGTSGCREPLGGAPEQGVMSCLFRPLWVMSGHGGGDF
jgi:hypothetical protein